MKNYCALHVHTSYSKLDGASKIDELVHRADELGMKSLSITDHGSLGGWLPFYKECRKHDINPLLGCELYLADDRTVRENVNIEDEHGEIAGSKHYYHLTSIAATNEGYHNLMKVSSDAYLTGLYRKPRTDWDFLSEHSKGVIFGTGCLGSPILQPLLHGNYDKALETTALLKDIADPGNLFVEVMNHDLPEQLKTNPMLFQIAKELDLPVCASLDSHYTKQEDAFGHEILLCQPPGTQISRVIVHSKKGLERGAHTPNDYFTQNIEDVKVGDRVVTWSSAQRNGRIVQNGAEVTQIQSRYYDDDLVIIETPSGTSSSYTKDHICIARTSGQELRRGNEIVYLMRKGNQYRIGKTKYIKQYSSRANGLSMRIKEQGADAGWILSICETDHEAREMEAYLSWFYGIPTWSFPEPTKIEHMPRTPYYGSLWERVGDLTERATVCLNDHGKMIQYPLYEVDGFQMNNRRPHMVRACNLEEGMLVCEPDRSIYTTPDLNEASQAWQSISLRREHYEGLVYSIEVDKYHSYIADGILTHNCCGTGSKLADENRFKFHNDQYYLKSYDEMLAKFPNNPEVLANTLLVAEKCNVEIDFTQQHLPDFPVPEGFTDDVEYLRHLVTEGAKQRYPEITREVEERINYELGVIADMGVSSYFLIVWDLMRFADEQGIQKSPGRGSSSGSICFFSLGVTQIDPIEYKLPFERFLNPSRVTMPDADIDMPQRDREKFINYTIEKYGEEYVSYIATFGTIKARTAVRDTARVMGLSWDVGDKISKAIPPLVSGVETPLWACFDRTPKYESGYQNARDLRNLYETDPEVRSVIDNALKLEGQIRQSGLHAAGILIGDRPLKELVPLEKRAKGPVFSQWDKKMVESVGLVKMDFLGLQNLDIIDDVCKSVGITTEDIPLGDYKTMELFQSGNTIGCFQVDSKGMRDLLVRLKPTDLRDIAAVLALYRPGPMAQDWHNEYADAKNGRLQNRPFHPDAAIALGETYNIPLYQEQLMELSRIFAGYTMAEADNLRKIIGRKEIDEMVKERTKFVEGCIANGYERELSNDLFNKIDGFSLYGFSKLHALPYGLVSYWTGYLKTHYPREYMAALCSAASDDLEKMGMYLHESRRMGLKVYPPDLNKSERNYNVEEDGIRMGLSAMKNMGQSADSLIQERDNGRFHTLHDFAKRYNPNSQVFKSLAYSGALDSFGTRQGIAAVVEDILKSTRKESKKNSVDQGALFAAEELSDFFIPTTEFPEMELLNREKETLGIYVSGHPLDSFSDKVTKYTIADLKELPDQKGSFEVLCMISSLKVKYTKAGDPMADIMLEDQTGTIDDAVCFPKQWRDLKGQFVQGSIVKIKLRLGKDYRDNRSYIVTDILKIDDLKAVVSDQIFGFFLPKKFHLNTQFMSRLKGIVLLYRGEYPLRLYTSRSSMIKMQNQYLVDGSDDLKEAVKKLFKEFNKEKGNK